MHWKRLVHGFLLGAGLSVFGVGCAAVNALVSSPAGHGASGSSPQRMVAIGRVFENQGHLAKAQAMYRQALRADPGNAIATERMEFIASINSDRNYSPSERRSQQAVSVADSLTGRNTRTTRSRDQQPSESETLKMALNNDAVIASLTPSITADNNATLENESESDTAPAEVATTELADAFRNDEGDWTQIVDTSWELAELEGPTEVSSEQPVLKSLPVAEMEIETVAFDHDETAATVQVTTADEWKASDRGLVTLEELAGWIESPSDHCDDLIRALQFGVDDGVKALAATILTECSTHTAEINRALTESCDSPSELLGVTARDALIQRGAVDEAGVEQLLGFFSSRNPEIRAQAAASLRNCAGSHWAEQCVAGLTGLLQDDEPEIVAIAASTLGDFGQDAVNCIGLLEQLCQGTDILTAQAAAVSLERIQSPMSGLRPVNLPPAEAVESTQGTIQYLPAVE